MSLEETTKESSAQPSPTNLSRKRPASERTIQANRGNALRSTGPKTERGKRTVARNALKHGILAREVVITAGDGEESLEEFHDLVEQLCDYYEPVGIVEESLVQTIAACWWKKARVIRAENGEIRKRLDTQAVDWQLRNSDKGNLDVYISQKNTPLFNNGNWADQQVSTWDRLSALQEAQSDLRRHRCGLEYLSALLLEAKSQVASDGHISEWLRKVIFNIAYSWDYLLANACSLADPSEASGENLTLNQGILAALIDAHLETINALKEHAKERDDLGLDAEARSFSLPPADATDKILRYEAHLDRQLYRAMDQLERLQRQRRGENVPPPLNINLGRRR